jgi:hypothetical protein
MVSLERWRQVIRETGYPLGLPDDLDPRNPEGGMDVR